jgi:hypothetical protein
LFRVTNKGDTEPSRKGLNGNRASFDNGFLDVEASANSGSKKVSVKLDSDDDNKGAGTAYVLYEKFGDSLDHDPTLGLDTAPPDTTWIGIVVAVVVIGVIAALFLGFLIVGVVAYFVSKRNHQFSQI